ncbi:glutamate--tRNA ligase [Buchnera aphidicola]|uniref:glutamate--tRNA ligase n=1 Tax=Buchnera aphidicola TaxID=9 RepID=UPI0031B8669B
MKVITRFSPSPTGNLHIGNLRTALYSWLFAKHYNGKFILRIEDTDTKRCKKKYIEEIISSLKILGLNWDKGPYFQSERLNKYKKFIFYMLKYNLAYKCYCSKKRLKKLREMQIKKGIKPKYDKKCRNNNKKNFYKKNFVIRFKNPLSGKVIFFDKIRGKIEFNNNELDDLIIQRNNGLPTYNFCVVIDDLEMGVTHVIRGEDHINNTPRQINILKSLNAKIPVYAHLSMVLDNFGKKLSKRNNSKSLIYYLKNGFFSESLLNYISRLGWSHGNKEIFTINEIIKKFSLNKISNSPSIFNENKLLWYNNYYMNILPKDYVIKELKKKYIKFNIDISFGPDIEKIFSLFKSRVNTLNEIVVNSIYFYKEVNYNNCINYNLYINKDTNIILSRLYVILKYLYPWNVENLSCIIKRLSVIFNIHLPNFLMTLRIILTGLKNSPSIYLIIYILKKKNTLKRIKNFIYYNINL